MPSFANRITKNISRFYENNVSPIFKEIKQAGRHIAIGAKNFGSEISSFKAKKNIHTDKYEAEQSKTSVPPDPIIKKNIFIQIDLMDHPRNIKIEEPDADRDKHSNVKIVDFSTYYGTYKDATQHPAQNTNTNTNQEKNGNSKSTNLTINNNDNQKIKKRRAI